MTTSNQIVLENQLPGTPQSVWDLSGPGSTNIEGFTTDISINHADTANFKINTDSTNYRIDIYRLGYYGGDGARLVTSIQHQSGSPIFQPPPLVDPSTGLVDAGNWQITDSWTIPADAVSGVYIAKLVRQDGVFGENHIPFVVRNDGGQSDIVFQTSDTTWQAYNGWGGHNVYVGSVAVSYNRPFVPRANGDPNFLFGAEYPAMRWLEANGYDVSYIAGVDTARSGSQLSNHNIFLSVGHDEYWSAEQRANVEAARDAGVNLAFWSGNEIFWKTQWGTSLDTSATPYRTMITYKETQSGKINPSGVWTGTWRDPSGVYSPENGLSGTIFTVNLPGSPAPITIPYEYSQFRFWRNTNIANLQSGQTASLPSNMLGFEFDEDLDNGFRPAGLIEVSSTAVSVNSYLQDYGSTYAPGTATHSLTLYRAPSGALVFGAGTVLWSWGLDSTHDYWPDGVTAPTDRNIQQAMVNLFADMGVQPFTLQPGLVLATQSTDHEAPVSALTGVRLTGAEMTLLGTATDTGGGLVAGMEISYDNGGTWHPALGSASWSYPWINSAIPAPNGLATLLVESRAVDDSLNLETPKQYTVPVVGFSGYLSANWDVAAAGVDPLSHYLLYGSSEARDPAYNFDDQLYVLYNPDAAGTNPLKHYLEYGWSEGRATYPAIGNALQDGLFDPVYYSLANPDVGQAGVDPLQHWFQYGWAEGRNPNAYFDTQGYLARYTDVAAAGVDPLAHYYIYGWQEGRDPSTQFDTQAYQSANPDVAAANINPLQHFLQTGAFEKRSPLGDGAFA